LRDVWLHLAELASRTLNVERVGVWILVDEGRALRCRYLLQHSNREIYQGAVLRAQDFPTYFAAMGQQRAIAADDAPACEYTSELFAAYLQPLGISALLDAPIYLDGHVVGIVCHEHIGGPRQWTEAECAFAGSVADNIARLYGEHERHNAESALEGYQRHLLELNRMEALGRMAAGIAHDFRGIVGVALGFAELLRRIPQLPAQADQYAQRIVESLERGRKLTQEVMHFGKDDPLSPRVLDVGAVIEEISPMLRVMLGEKNLLNLDLDRSVSRVLVDPAQLERTLLNLVLNARDAMPDGGEVKIELAETRIEDGDGEDATYVTIGVRDTGCGMDEHTRLNAFKPFFTTKGDQGTGLGLVIVDQIVSRCGGRLALDSQPGHGTTVRVHLPRIAAAG
jgi:signal transduction histidine kinase